MRCKNIDTLRLGTAGILGGWALQGYLVVGQCKDTLWLGLQGYSAVGHCRDIWWLGTAGILGGWSRKSASSRARTTSTLQSNNPTARVGNKGIESLRNPQIKDSLFPANPPQQVCLLRCFQQGCALNYGPVSGTSASLIVSQMNSEDVRVLDQIWR